MCVYAKHRYLCVYTKHRYMCVYTKHRYMCVYTHRYSVFILNTGTGINIIFSG